MTVLQSRPRASDRLQPRIDNRIRVGAGVVTLCCGLGLGLAGCGSEDAPPAASSAAESSPSTSDGSGTDSTAGTESSGAEATPGQSATGTGRIDVEQRFAQWADGVRAVTYDPQAIPVGSSVSVEIEPRGSGVKVELDVDGVQANRSFGAHVHEKACGASGDDAGPHYQDQKDPNTPSTDPAYANDRNEVWLDFTTDAKGDGEAESTQQWTFRPGEGRSVVIHEKPTATHHGEAGTAGARLACVTLF